MLVAPHGGEPQTVSLPRPLFDTTTRKIVAEVELRPPEGVLLLDPLGIRGRKSER